MTRSLLRLHNVDVVQAAGDHAGPTPAGGGHGGNAAASGAGGVHAQRSRAKIQVRTSLFDWS